MKIYPVLQTGLLNQSSAQVIDGSLRFDDARNNRLKRTVSDGNRRTFTFACWVKRGVINATPINIFAAGSNNFRIALGAGDGYFQVYNYNGSSHDFIKGTASMYRDTGWYHLVVAIDTTDGTAADRMKLYVNGERLGNSIFTNGNTNPSDNFQSYVNDSSNTHYLGYIGASGYDLDAYLSQAYFIDGQALGPENFGFTDPLTNTWRPKKFSGNYTVDDGYSKTWTNEITGTQFNSSNPKEHAFDGDLNTWTTATNGNSLTWTPSGGLAVSSSLRIYAAREGSNDNITVTFTDTTTFNSFTADNTFKWYTITGAGGKTIDNIVWTHNNTFSRIAAIEVDGTILTDFQGTNSFYLPMDGNSPIGQDKSGRGNNWTPVNFGGSNSVDKATGALPILNTTPGGVSASVGVRTDANANSLALALPLASDLNAVTNQINSGATNRTILSHNSPSSSTTKSNFYGRSYYLDGSQAITIGVIGTDLQFGSDDFTMEMWFNSNTTLDSTYWNPIVSFPWHGNTNENSQLWIGFAGGTYSPYSTGELHARIKTASGIVELPTGILTAYNDNAWHHVAVTRNGSTASIYVDGALRSTASISGSLNTSYGSYEAFIGAYDHGGGGFNSFFKGYVSDFRVYKGAAKYTSDFVVSSTNPDILPDTPSGVSGGSKLTKITDGAVSFDGDGDYLYVPATDEFTFGTSDFTIETFVYHNTLGGSGNVIIDFRDAPNNADAGALWKTSGGEFGWYVNGSNRVTGATVAANKWYHVALVRNYGTTSLYVDGISVGSFSDSFNYATKSGRAHIGFLSDGTGTLYLDGFISNFRINKGTALYTSNFTPPSAPLTNVTNTKLLCCQSNTSNRAGVVPLRVENNSGTAGAYAPSGLTGGIDFPGGQGTNANSNGSFLRTASTSFDGNYTIEFWFNVDELPSDGGGGYGSVFFDGRPVDTNADNILGSIYGYNTTGTTNNFTVRYHADSTDKITGSTQLSVNTWYHVALVRNNGVVNLYVNGTSEGSYSHSTPIISNNSRPYIGGWGFGSGGSIPGHNQYAVNGKMSNLRITSTAVYTANFTPPTSNLTAISGTTFLGLQSTSSATAFSSAVGVLNINGNVAATTFNPFNTDINTVRGQETGYATWNPLKMGTSDVSMSEGNLFWRTTSNGPDRCTYSTIGMDSGKWYWENEIVEATATAVGIANVFANQNGGPANAHNWMYYSATGQVYLDGGASSYGAAYNTNGTIIGVAFDRDNLTLEFYKNGASQGKLSGISGLTDSETYFAMCGDSGGASQSQVRVNFGQKPFKFPPPDGFQPLNGTNLLPERVFARPDQFFDTKLYTGTTQSPRTIDLSMTPDMIWIKNRTDNGTGHYVFDTVRGDNQNIRPDDTYTQASVNGASHGIISTIGSNSFTVKDGSSSGNNVGSTGTDNYVAWHWKAGGNKGTFNVDDVGYATAAAAGLTGGTLTPSGASVGTKQGFSIIQWEGTNNNKTISHGLSQTPEFIINKNIDTTTAWYVGSPYLTASNWLPYLVLDTNARDANNSDVWQQGGAPNATTFGVGAVGNSTGTHIAYLWHSVPGLQKFGSYTGNSSANGSYVELGFRPALLWLKRTDATGNWVILDTKRNPSNPVTTSLYIDTTDQDYDPGQDWADILSSGFKLRATYGEVNVGSYIYCAWAEAPAFNLYGGQSNAR